MSLKFFLKTYGCQMNFDDSDRLRTLLKINGFVEVENLQNADFVIINTCCVRQHAENRAISFLCSHKLLKNKKIFCLVGCVPSLYRDEIFKKYEFIDIICGTNSYKKFVSVLKNYNGEKISIFEEDEGFLREPLIPAAKNKLSSFLSITKGCENFCSYCVVPYTRGKLVSKPSNIVINEIKQLVEKGVKEIFLIGQNVNEYGKDIGERFVDLLYKISEIEGILRIGFLTSHPKDIPDELIDCFVNIKKLYKHLHLPLQSGSNKILKLMNRKYTAEKYLEIIEKVRKKVNNISITSDIIVGFPYEEKKDFLETYNLVKKIEFDDLFVFKYSPRPQTKASEFLDTVSEEEKRERHFHILNLQDKISLLKNKKVEGQILDTFIKEKSFKKENTYIGRTETNKPVLVNFQKDITGKVLKIRVIEGLRHYFIGEVL
ncbi:MAG: tRNA (N6-isopentenyl adenosine(37)-C2)-methylthiotransferase MiaB [Candidatus Omnitrophica bacterium]|nr:tRNA (N6-isopentenyl adenosine(37)-C2)-methylthiotransferase MiaB [Candidatus Omnitrophota bacterium]